MEQSPSKFLSAFSVLFPEDAGSPHTLANKIPKEINHNFFIHWKSHLKTNISEINEKLKSYIIQNAKSKQNIIDTMERYEAKSTKNIDNLFKKFKESLQSTIDSLNLDFTTMNEEWLYKDIQIIKNIKDDNLFNSKTQNAFNIFFTRIFSRLASNPFHLNRDRVFQSIINVLQEYIPNLWNAYLYTYVYNIIFLPQKTPTYFDITLSFLVMETHRELQSLDTSISLNLEEYTTYVKQFFSEHGKFNKKAEEIIYHPTRNRSQKCRENNSKITLSLLVYFSILYLKTHSKTDFENFIKKLNLDVTQLHSLIYPTEDSPCFSKISEDEHFLADKLFMAIPTEKKPKLHIFFNTEQALLNQQIPNHSCKEAIDQINALRNHTNYDETLCASMEKQLMLLIRYCESISDEIHLRIFPKMLKKNDPKANIHDYIIELLYVCEQDFIQRKEKDIWFSRVLQAQQYDTLKFAWQVEKAPSYESVILSIYQDIQDKIQLVFSKKASKCKTDPRYQYTESDLEQALSTYAFHSSLPDNQILMWELIKATSLLTPNGTFKNEDVKFVCAGIYFANQFGIGEINEIKNQYIYYIQSLIQKSYDHTSHIDFFCKNGVTFGTIALLLMPPKTRYLFTYELCQELDDNMFLSAGKQRALYQTLTLILTLLLSEAKAAHLPSDLTAKVMNTVFGRTFYPQFMDILKSIKATPFNYNYIEQQFNLLKAPKLQNELFPSPFYLYFFASNITSAKSVFFKLKDRSIVLKEDIEPLQTSLQCYSFCLQLVGATWRVIHKTQTIKFDLQTFSYIRDALETLWDSAKLQKPTLDLLYLVWSTHLLLIATSNLARANQYPDQDDFQKAIPSFIKIGMLADAMQRKYNGEYQAFLRTPAEARNDFWLISGLHRYVSVLQDSAHHTPSKVYFDFTKRNDMISLYENILTAELNAGNYRFYILLCRNLEEYSNFYENTSKCMPLNKKNLEAMKIYPESVTEIFLPYDNLELYIRKIISR